MGEFFYGKYSKEQVEQANQVDLEQLLCRNGEELLRSGRDKRLASDHSITIRGNRWYDHAAGEGGFSLSFVRRHYNLSFGDAMQLLTGENGQVPLPYIQKKPEEPAKEFVLPTANQSMRRVYGYLVGYRQIDPDVLSAFVKRKLVYEDTPYHNAVFVGMDENGAPCHAHKRSTVSTGKQFRLNVEGSNPAYSFHWNGVNRSLYVFEAPVDLLSYISLNPEGWQQNSYIALCGVGSQAMLRQLELRPELHEVFLCLDNDQAGQTASERLTEQLERMGKAVYRLVPQMKDWNDNLREEVTLQQQEGGMVLGF